MIQEISFLGMPLRTRRQRQMLVMGYYAILLIFALLALWRGVVHIAYLIPQVVTLGGLLGGIKMGGPVKYFYDTKGVPKDGSGLESLNLSGRRPFSVWGSNAPMDERERAQRDGAHFKAYRIVMITLGLATCAYWIAVNADAAWVTARMPLLLWVMLIYVLSLPQAVLLWTEPQAPVAELIELPVARA